MLSSSNLRWARLLSSQRWKSSSAYLRLLFQTGPSSLDIIFIVLGIIFAIGAGLPFPLLGIVLGQLVDSINTSSCQTEDQVRESLQDSIKTQIIYMVIITIANFICLYIQFLCWSLVGERLVRRLREQYFKSLLRQELNFFDTLSTGEVSTRLSEDLDAIQTGTSEKVGIFITSISYFIAAYVVAFIKAPRIAGMLVSLVPAYLIMGVVGGYLHKKYTNQFSEHLSKGTSIASDCLKNFPVVVAFGAADRVEKIFASHLQQSIPDGMKKAFVSAGQFGLMYFIGFAANALAYWQGSREIAASVARGDGGSSVGSVYTVIFLLIDVSYIISQVAPFLNIFGTAAASGQKLYHTINRVSEIDGTNLDDGKRQCTLSSSIDLKYVHFAYSTRPDTVVLDDVSMHIPAKKHTAIVGLSGSGKSTIAALLGRFYDVPSGTITIDGHDIKDINVNSLRRCIGFVEQDSRLLDLSILENIAHGLINSAGDYANLRSVLLDDSLPKLVAQLRSGVDIEQALGEQSDEVKEVLALVKVAAEHADAAKFISRLKFGLATGVGSKGNQLSGGQKQRVALARALVGDPQILILDEATASLDSVSEKKIQAALAKVSTGRTVISIAHRLSTIQSADQIIVMRQGKIVEQGTHSELLTKEGAYASMVGLQSLVSLGDGSGNESLDSITTLGTTTPARLEKPPIAESGYPDEKSSGLPGQGTTDSATTLVADKPRSLWMTIKGISTMLRPFMLVALLGIFASVIVGGSYSGEAIIFGNTVQNLSACNEPQRIIDAGELFGLLFFVLGIVKLLANVIAGSAFGMIAQKLLFRIRVAAFRSLLSQDVQWHESEGKSPATLLSHLTTDTNALGSLAGTTIMIAFSVVVTLIAGIVLSHIVAWKIAVVLLAAIPVLLGSGFMRLRVLAQFQERHRKAFAQSVGITIEAVSSIKTIATYSLEHASMQSYKRSLKGPYDATLKAITFGNLWLALAFSVSILVYALAYWWGSKQIMEGTYTQTQFFIVLPALLISAQSCGQLFSLAPDLSKARVAAGNILDLLDIGPDKDTSETAVHIKSLEHELEEKDKDVEATGGITPHTKKIKKGMDVTISNIRFSYPAQPLVQVLHGIDIRVRAGQFCALVGPSGSGKSTVISLLERFYMPSSGAIEMDGYDILKSNDSSFRNNIALVPQESTLFDGTVAFNVSLGAAPDQTATQEEIEEACKLANIHDTIMGLPQGYETPTGSHGDNFSGGQKQRLSIARALIRKPRLLLLDETTSALDAESEMLLQKSLEKLAMQSGMTIIAVAHRLHTIQKADTIFMLEDGLVVDSGRHEELVRRSEAYRENVLHQSLDT